MIKKMTDKEIKDLKAKHRIESVMLAAGEVLQADSNSPEILRGAAGLVVNTRMQNFTPKNKHGDDVLAWIQFRYTWSFAMALKFLQNRTPDPIQSAPPKTAKQKRSAITYTKNDYVIISNYHVNPITGAESYGMDFNYSIMDDLQKRAIDLWNDVYKHFDKSSEKLRDIKNKYPHRFKQVIDLDIEKCKNCEKPFNWKEYGVIGYAEEKKEFVEVYLSHEDNLDIGAELSIDAFFVDQDFVICEKCMRSIYAPRYAALKLVYRSACRREEARENERRELQREREREEERQEVEIYAEERP